MINFNLIEQSVKASTYKDNINYEFFVNNYNFDDEFRNKIINKRHEK